MEKCIKDGQIGVIFSPGFGAGWTTWAHDATKEQLKQLSMDRRLVELVIKKAELESLQGRLTLGEMGTEWHTILEQIKEIAEQILPEMYMGGAEDLEVSWLEPGTLFWIEEYDGSESLHSDVMQDKMEA